MGLQTDADGNFYYAKAARHALPALVPHHGTLLKVSKDGVDDGDPRHRLPGPERRLPEPGRHVLRHRPGGALDAEEPDQLVEPGGFYGNMWGYTDVTDTSDAAMEQPLCWITNAFDRSPGGDGLGRRRQTWGPLDGSLLNLSYGTGRSTSSRTRRSATQMQGGMVALPIPPFPTGVMRGRFHPPTASSTSAACSPGPATAGARRVLPRPLDRQAGALADRLPRHEDGLALTFTRPARGGVGQ